MRNFEKAKWLEKKQKELITFSRCSRVETVGSPKTPVQDNEWKIEKPDSW